MPKLKFFAVFDFIFLAVSIPSGGQNTATPIRSDTYYFISNQATPNDQVINYEQQGKKIMLQNARYSWRFVPDYVDGHWEIMAAGQNNADPNGNKRSGYTWVPGSSANQYKIQVLINGKFWALSSTQDAYPILTENANPDMYQSWEVEAQADGYYKITNVGLRITKSPYTNLFVNTSTSELFLAPWDEAKSFNGKWFLIMAGLINENDGKDKFDNRRLILTSFTAKKNMCMNYIWTSDATGEYRIGTCGGADADRFIFKKTITGAYFIKIETNQQGQNQSFYLDYLLNARGPEEFDILNPFQMYTWNITDLGNGLFMISSLSNGNSLEFVKGYYRNSGTGSWGSNVPDHIELRQWAGKYEQQWFLWE